MMHNTLLTRLRDDIYVHFGGGKGIWKKSLMLTKAAFIW